MPYVTSIERRAKEEGQQEGRMDGMKKLLLGVLQARFGDVPARLEAQFETIDDLVVFEKLGIQAAVARSLEEFEKAMPSRTRADSGSSPTEAG